MRHALYIFIFFFLLHPFAFSLLCFWRYFYTRLLPLMHFCRIFCHFLSIYTSLSLSLSISFTFSLSLLFHIKYSSPVWCFFLLSSFRWIFSFPMLSRPPLLSYNLYFLLHLSLPHCLCLLSVSCSYLFPLYLPEANIIYFLSFYLAAQYMLVSLPVLHF